MEFEPAFWTLPARRPAGRRAGLLDHVDVQTTGPVPAAEPTPTRFGDVVRHPAPFREGGRPYVVLNDDGHPFYGEEYLVVGVTTTGRERAVELGPDRWE